jgi:hypothetical protein
VTHVAKVSAMTPKAKKTSLPTESRKGMKPCKPKSAMQPCKGPKSGKPTPHYYRRGYWQRHYKPVKPSPKPTKKP